jgi:tRNA (cytidine/uridine-2'-O-)-methyltransferase
VAIHVVLFEPEIPQNTGNIARSCAATGACLHLIEPLGFSISDRYLKRAGLDYWPLVDVHSHHSWLAYLEEYPAASRFYATTKGSVPYQEVSYPLDAHLVFGPESRGLPVSMLEHADGPRIRIPMRPAIRSLNLSNSVAVILFEALRQHDFSELVSTGSLSQAQEQGNQP